MVRQSGGVAKLDARSEVPLAHVFSAFLLLTERPVSDAVSGIGTVFL